MVPVRAHHTREQKLENKKKAKAKQNKTKEREEPTIRSSRVLPQANSVTYLILLLNKKQGIAGDSKRKERTQQLREIKTTIEQLTGQREVLEIKGNTLPGRGGWGLELVRP